MRFLHTADWQIGMRCLQAGERADEVRAARVATIGRIVEVANDAEVDFILVAGDQFESRTPTISEIGAVASVLRAAQMPVFVLPGNHDPAGMGGPYGTPIWSSLAGSRVITILEPVALDIPGGVLLAAPCTAKYGSADPTAWFASHESAPDAIRIGLAHGTLQLRTIPAPVNGEQRGSFPIALDAASRARLAYLALGHWHDYTELHDGAGLIAYSGTPEPTAFDDRACGTVSLVSIAAAGSMPLVERVPVGTLRWYDCHYDVSDDASILVAAADLRDIENPRHALVRVTLEGLCSPSAAHHVIALEAEMKARFLNFEVRRSFAQRPATRDAWLDLLPPGDLRGVATTLMDSIDRGDDPAVAARALDLLAGFAR